MSPPHKYANEREVNEGSGVTFYKNGRAVLNYQSLRQAFYCVAVSLYNYAQV
jgi:hypothetical protein